MPAKVNCRTSRPIRRPRANKRFAERGFASSHVGDRIARRKAIRLPGMRVSAGRAWRDAIVHNRRCAPGWRHRYPSMPTKLKRLFAHAAAGRKPFDPGRVRRQQQVLLYGGGSAVTAFILVCAALVVRLDVQDSLGQARSTFLQREAEFYGQGAGDLRNPDGAAVEPGGTAVDRRFSGLLCPTWQAGCRHDWRWGAILRDG